MTLILMLVSFAAGVAAHKYSAQIVGYVRAKVKL